MEFGPILRAMKRNKVRFGLIILEIALTLAIVTNCVNLIEDARKGLATASGFDDENLIVVRSTPFDPAFKENGYLDNGVQKDLAALRGLPGVKAASNTRFLPWQGGGSSTELKPLGGKGPMLRTQIYNADEATLGTLGTELREGRTFTAEDVERDDRRLRVLFAGPRALGDNGRPAEPFSQDVVISKAFANLAFPGQAPLGQRLEDSDGDQYSVIGIFDRFYNPYGWPIHEYGVFFANHSRGFEGGAPYLVRTEPGQRERVQTAVEATLLKVDGGRNLRVRSLVEIRERQQSGQVLLVRILGGVIGLLVFVTSLGVVGLTSFSVAERTRQIGTRRALGAQKEDILRYFLLENWLVTTMGLAVGLLLAYALNILLVDRAGGAKIAPSVLGTGVAFLWASGLLSTFLPALKGIRVEPAVATRNV